MRKIDGSRVTLCSVFIDKFLCGNGFPGDEVEKCPLSGKGIRSFPFVCMARVLEDVDAFVDTATLHAAKIKNALSEVHVSSGKLNKANAAASFEFLQSLLAMLLAKAMPETVAIL